MTHEQSFTEPAGLEVVQLPIDRSGLQLAAPSDVWLQTVQASDEQEKIVTDTSPQERPTTEEPRPPTKKNRRRKIGFIVLACTIIVIGVVVGAVVGTVTKRSQASAEQPKGSSGAGNDGSNVNIESSGADMTGSPSSVTPGLYPTAVSWGYPHLEVLAVTNNDSHNIYRKYRNSNATSEYDFVPKGAGMELVDGWSVNVDVSPSIVAYIQVNNMTNLTVAFITGLDRRFYYKYDDDNEIWYPSQSGSWYYTSDNQTLTAPAIVALTQVIRIFCVMGGDQGLAAYYYTSYSGEDWTDRVQINGPDLQPMTPAVVDWNGNGTRLDVFAIRGANSHLLHAFWDAETDQWSDYEDLHGFVTTPPTVVSREPETLNVFVRGGDGGLWSLVLEDGKWSNWTRISGNTTIQGQPDAISIATDRIDVFAWGQNGEMLHKSFNASSKSWEPQDEFEIMVNGGLTGPPRSFTDAPNQIHVLAYYNNSNQIVWKTLRTDGGSSSDLMTLADVPS